MFVKHNNLTEIKNYFKVQLTEFSNTERSSMVRQLAVKRLGISAAEFLLSDDVLLSESDLLYFRSAVKRLQANEPFQYILGELEFYGVVLRSDRRALVPRPETEELVDWVVQTLDGCESKLVLDLCSGSGCIAFALKRALPMLVVKAMELSEEAFELIRENTELTTIAIDVVKADVLIPESYSRFQKKSFDVWVSNPPYIPGSDKKRMHKNVLDFEPHMALFVADKDPLLFYREVAINAKEYLKHEGYLFFEINEDFGTEMIDLLSSLGFVNIELRKDMQGRARMMRAQNVLLSYESK
ncbi:MAG: peptide chain release factor N(5)-glutamine methyltransferase [Crocinitomicaceae bacterium]|nr:peptide chain release factor N(5)-glutamine methyltransferase [Crocinitomicaceae bacterium]